MTYRIYATKAGQFVNIQRSTVTDAARAAVTLRALGWEVTVSR
jgi:hypothetical protein